MFARAPHAWTLAALGLLALTARTADCEPSGGTVRITLPIPVRTLDPTRGDHESARAVVANAYERLYAYHPLARPYELVPGLAEGPPEVSEDGLVWRVRLKEGVHYVDDPCFEGGRGRAVVAGDVVFCLLRLMDRRVESTGRWVLQGRLEGIDAFTEASATRPADPKRTDYGTTQGYPAVPGLRAVDEHTVEFRLTRPEPDFGWYLASTYASVYAPESVAAYGADLGRHMVGTGPYRLRTFLPEKSLVLVANPTYRERTYPATGARGDAESGILDDAGRRLPLNGMVVVAFEPDAVVAWNAFLQGAYDLANIPPSVIPTVFDPATGDLMASLKERGIRLAAQPRLEISFLAFRMADPVVGHPAGEKGLALRRAICLADDITWERQQLYRNSVVPVEGPLLDEFPESDPSFLAPWTRHDNETPEEALDAARTVLAEAGWREGKGAPALRIDVLDHPGIRQAFTELESRTRAIGLVVEPVFVSWPEMRRRIEAGEAQIWSTYWEADVPTARTFLDLFHAPGRPDAVAGGYTNPAYDEIYEEARLLGPGEERTRLFRELQEIVAQDCPWRFRYRRLQLDAVHGWLHNYRFNEIVPSFFEYLRVDLAARNAYRR